MSEEANFYVYVYIDPRSFEEFYYGKGRGSRKHAHWHDDRDSEKTRRIAVIQRPSRGILEGTRRVRAEGHQGNDGAPPKRDFAGERNVFTTRIQALEKTVAEQAEQIARLSQQAERAYAQVQDIAVKALEGPASFKSFAAFQPIMPEQPRRAQPEK